MGNYIPLYIFLGLLLGIGVLLHLFISPIINTEEADVTSVIYPFIDFFTEGIQLDFPVINIFGFNLMNGIDLDFFFWLPDNARNAMISYFNIFTYIPNLISLPIMIIMIVSLVYTIIKLFWGT